MSDLRRYWAITGICAVLFSVLGILPNILQRFDAEYPFQGVEILGSDQEQYYAARLRETLDGHWGLGNVYSADKNRPFVHPPFAEWIMGGIGTGLGLHIGPTMIVGKLLFGILLFLTMVGFLGRLSNKRWSALVATSAVLCAWFLFAAPWVLRDALAGLPLGSSFLRFARLTNPQVSVTLFFAGLWALTAWMQSRTSRPMLLTGVVLGLSFYAYPYTWSYLLAVIGVLGLVACTRRDKKMVGGLAMIVGVALIVALPYLLHQHALSQDPAYASLLERFGLVQTRALLWGGWMTVMLILGIVAARRIGRPAILVFAIAAAAVIAMNQQVITGVTVVPHHYHWYFIHPLAVAFLLLWIGSFAERRIREPKKRMMIALVLVLFFAGWGIKYQLDSYAAQRALWGEKQDNAPLFAALNAPEFADATVFAFGDIREEIPVFSHANVFHAMNEVIACLCSTEQLRERYFLELRLAGVSAQQAADEFPTSRRVELSGRLFSIGFRERTGSYEGIPDATVAQEADGYRAFLERPIADVLAVTPIDAVVLRRGEPVSAQLRQLLDSGALAWSDERYELWDLR